MRIGVDLDGVLADFNSAFIERVIQVTGQDRFPPRPFDIQTWDYPEHYSYTKQEIHDVWESIKADQQFWQHLSPYIGVFSFLNNLSRREDDVYFITSRVGIQAKYQTETWLRCNGYFTRPTVLISSKKGLCARALLLDTYVDDRWENCTDVVFESRQTQVYLLDRPWNRAIDYSRIRRISSLDDMLTT